LHESIYTYNLIQTCVVGMEVDSQSYSEQQTRKLRIDVFLNEQGWDVSDRSQVIEEVDTKQSDFVTNTYRTYGDTYGNGQESRYADYLLLDSNGAAIAIIEAKKTSKDPRIGQKQAEQYADDVKVQTSKDVFVYYTNGIDIWFWDRERYPPRKVAGFHSQKDLERFRFQIDYSECGPMDVTTSIVDRPKSIENVKRILEHIESGHRKGLIVMATGTGKTRVAMGIIDSLLRHKRVQKVLFLADRKALRDQAWSKGFLQFFPNESRSKILGGVFEKESRLYVSTIQTFMEIYNQKDDDGRFLISPGEFDLIISDEAHRSIYNKWKDVFEYLDAIQIGLTATPAQFIERDTFRFFDCPSEMPTALYDYKDAVNDGILCDFREHIVSAKTKFQIDGITPKDLTDEQREKLIEKGIDPDEFNFEGTALEKKVAVKGTSEAIVQEFMDNCLTDESGMLPAKTIFFAISKSHAYRLEEAFNDLYPEHRGTLAKVIVSEDPRAQSLIEEFSNNDLPRVAISVDMLDTGIDVPEVCNLVFAKPVFSFIKFWQMLGRGTRSNAAFKRKDWLPNGAKEFFMVLDFWGNFDYWKMHTEKEGSGQGEALTTKIFMTRLKQLELLTRINDSRIPDLRKKIIDDVNRIPRDNVTVRKRENEIVNVLKPRFWDNVGIDPIDYARRFIGPLMRYVPGVDAEEHKFVLKCERLALAILQNDKEEISRQMKSIGSIMNELPSTIEAVAEKEKFIDEVKTPEFWENITYDDTQRMIDELAPLMPYRTQEPRSTIVIDMSDYVKQRTLDNFDFEDPPYVRQFKERYEERIRAMLRSHPVLQKIVRNEGLTEEDLIQLEVDLQEQGIVISDEKAQSEGKHTLVELIKLVLKLKGDDLKQRVEKAFDDYIAQNNKKYNAEQLVFIKTIQTYFARRKHVEIKDLWGAPFTNLGTNVPEPMFGEKDLKDFINICDAIEKDLYGGEV